MVAQKKIVAAIGNFDGVHLGHRHLLSQTSILCDELDASLAVALFAPHPRRFFQPDSPPFLITTPQQRDEALRAAGVETIFALPFDKDFAALPPEAFVGEVLVKELGVAGVVTGVDFRFGKARKGDVALLTTLGNAAGLSVRSAALLERPDTEKFGSSGVRAALRAGNVRAAAKQLGRLWCVRQRVIHGQKLGRTLGYPTANMSLGEVLEPRCGIYATRAIIDGNALDGVSSFGRRPTVSKGEPLLETHIFDFDGDLYGREIDIEFVDFLRDEEKFDSLNDLKMQMAKDCDAARAILSAERTIMG